MEKYIEKAVLAGCGMTASMHADSRSHSDGSLDELADLAYTAGADVVGRMLQRKPAADPAYLIGRGKVEELAGLCRNLEADTVIFDEELSGAQVRNLEEALDVKVVDRTMLILDIFAQRARSREGKLQVELAQLKYRLPRLTGLGGQLSRLGGGIGTRGPGEKKLDIDRRHIKRRIIYLQGELAQVRKRRNLLRENRRRNTIPTIALVGYTNVGKSTLLNRLCCADAFVEDKLFATLDPTTRKLSLPDGRTALLVDTVGFIRKLPHELIEAFKSTLEEAVFADVLLHVMDASSPEMNERSVIVEGILQNLGAMNKTVLAAVNKVDLVGPEMRIPAALSCERTYEISAVSGQGIGELISGIMEALPVEEVEIDILAPYDEGWVIAFIHENGRLLEQSYTEAGTRVRAVLPGNKAGRLAPYTV